MKGVVNFIENRIAEKEPNTWWKRYIWYGLLLSLIVLCFINVAFLIANWSTLDISISDTNMYITFVGFLFAFAGINIYSIFNTNIEEEKKRLIDLSKVYEIKIKQAIDVFEYSQKLITYFQITLLMSASKNFNSQIFEWIDDLNKIIDDYTVFLYDLSKQDNNLYDRMSFDFIEINRGICYSYEDFYNRISANDSSYFSNTTNANKRNVLQQLNETLSKIREIQVKDFSSLETHEESKDSPSIRKGLNIIWNCIREQLHRSLHKA